MWVDFQWVIPNRVLASRHNDLITMEDIRALSRDRLPKPGVFSGPIHLIIDMTARGTFEPSMFRLREMQDMFSSMDKEKVGWIIVVDPNPHPIMRFIGSTLTQVARYRLHIVLTLRDGVDFLCARDITLAPDAVRLYDPLPMVSEQKSSGV